MPEDFRYDVFISYSSHDKGWVRGELLDRIEKTGLRAFIDYRDFTRGAPSISECERGVRECRKTLLILTPDYIKSGWGEMENIMAQTLDPANRSLRLIPLLKSDCDKPLRIGALTHIDFTDGADHVLAWRQLLTALGKPPEPPPPKEPERDAEWFLAHPYPMPPNFTGRIAERAMLSAWLETDGAHRLLVMRALGGFGKSALAWHWLTHDVKHASWPCVVWWSFYEGDASFDNFLTKTLEYLIGETDPGKTPGKNAVRKLLQILHQPKTLLVLDGFERALRAFGGLDGAYQGDQDGSKGQASNSDGSNRDCISPLAEDFLRNLAVLPNLRSKVLLTTRLCPRVLEAKGGGFLNGCCEEELKQMQPADAVEFFRLQGIRGTHTEIAAACEPYGYHPLSLRLLAGFIVSDFEQPGDIAAAKRLDVSGDLVQRQHHVLEVAYDSLAPKRQAVLGNLACYRSSVKYETLKALTQSEPTAQTSRRKDKKRSPSIDQSSPALDTDLRDLVARGLLHYDSEKSRFDLHPIVRRYAYERLAAPDRAAAHTLLRDYFAAVPQPSNVAHLEDLAAVIELYYHTARAGQYDEACNLFQARLTELTYYRFGAYQLRIDLLSALFPDGEDRPPRLKDKSDQAWTLNSLANSYSLNGQPRRALPLFERVADIYENTTKNKSHFATTLSNLADDQLKVGALRVAEATLRQHIAICKEIKEEFARGRGHQELGRLLAYRGAYAGSETELATALKLYENISGYSIGQAVTWAYCARRELLLLRSSDSAELHVPSSALKSARRALELTDEWSRTQYPLERQYIRSHWLLGTAYRVAGQHDEAERQLHEALERGRRINMVDHEADILIDLARLRAATGQPDEAQRFAEEALLITERSGYVLQGADAHLEIAKLAIGRGDKAIALHHVTEARHLATCDGPPDYTYKAAYDEAGALLQQLS